MLIARAGGVGGAGPRGLKGDPGNAGPDNVLDGRPVEASSPSVGDLLLWNGSDWVPAAPTSTLPSLPAYHADLVVFGGVPRWRQREQANGKFNLADAFKDLTWPDFETRPFGLIVGAAVVTDDPTDTVIFTVSNVIGTGCRITPSRLFVGSASVEIVEVLS